MPLLTPEFKESRTEKWIKESAQEINVLARLAHETAKSKGWYSPPPTFADSIANIHGEVSEAWEDYRNGHAPSEVWTDTNGKPCGIPVELADVVIRIMDACAYHGIDLGEAVRAKMEFNRTRPVRHGGKVV